MGLTCIQFNLHNIAVEKCIRSDNEIIRFLTTDSAGWETHAVCNDSPKIQLGRTYEIFD